MTDILHSIPENPLPDPYMAGFFESFDGIKLRYALFKSPSQPVKGTIILAQGRNESIEKYAETISDLMEAGFWVAAFDWRGQGGSARLLKNARAGYVNHFQDYEKDLNAFLQKVVLPDAKLPFFLVGHSMGGLITLFAAPRLASRIERIVVSAPFVGLAISKPPPGVVGFMARLHCFLGLGTRQAGREQPPNRFENNVLTSDPVRFARNQALVNAFPELELGRPTWRWLHENLKAARHVCSPGHLQTITIPTLILGPTRDRVASYPAMERMSRFFRAGHLIPIDGAGHELFQESDRYRAQALAALEAFLPGGYAEPLRFDDVPENAVEVADAESAR